MLRRLKSIVLGKPLESFRLAEEKVGVFWGMPVLSSDAISSVAYAVEEMLWVLVPVAGAASFFWMPRIAATIILLMAVLIFSYRQLVAAYPGGGGAYIVAHDNLRPIYGLVAGASLMVDYTLTVAVSICAGTAAITSAFPGLYDYRVLISAVLVFVIAVANTRGIKESSRIFSIPTYAFIISLLILIVAGIAKQASGAIVSVPEPAMSSVSFGTEMVTVFLLMKAFSSGCAALTGVEAISNAVPNFKEPAVHNARVAYGLLGAAVLATFGGMVYLASIYHPVPNSGLTVVAQITTDIFGRGAMFFIIQASTAIILFMAANTAFAGFPSLLSVIARDRYVPRQFAMRGHRLNFNNGIMILALFAVILVLAFQADTHLLIPLYAIGVFTSFTLSQVGMVRHWAAARREGWRHRAVINGLGAFMTGLTVIILAITKFAVGAWMIVIVIPVLVALMLGVKRHYDQVARQLDVPNQLLDQVDLKPWGRNHVIVPVDSINAMVLKALRYARSISDSVVAFHVETEPGEADKLRSKWKKLNTDVTLVIRHTEYREVVGPLTDYIDSKEHVRKPGDTITILLPSFFVTKWWQNALHNNTSLFIANALFHRRDMVLAVMPFYLEEARHNRGES